MENKKSKKFSLDIAWMGIDGALVAGYFVVVGIILYAIIAHNDFIIGRLIPYAIMAAVTLIFINYISIILKFVKTSTRRD